MNKRLKQAGALVVAAFAAAQFVPADRTNPAIDATHTIEAGLGTNSALPAILARSCGDCHSNATVWPWYSSIAPVSWVMANGVAEGRRVVNFSEWGTYSADRQQALLVRSCQAASAGRMPGVWTLVRPETQLSGQDIETICAAASHAHAVASLAGGSK